MASLEDLIPDVMVEVEGPPRALVMRELVASVRTFCDDTQVWREELLISPIENVTEYTLPLPSHSDLSAVISDVDADAVPPDRLIFDVAPTEALPLTVALKPAYNANLLPDVIASQYREAVVSGAVYRLLMMTGRPWANPELAVYHKGVVDDAISRARAREFRGYTNRSMRIDAVRFI